MATGEGDLSAARLFDMPERTATFGKYQLFAKLGSGGMADVFLAVARGPVGFNKLSVIKRMRLGTFEEPELVGMFLDEARLSARLQHPNIVHTYEVGEQDGVYFIAMEYLEGQPLNRIVRASNVNEQFTPAMWARIVGDALAGLHYAHELPDYDGKPLGIVHRDVSPQNIFVTYAGHVKMVDFGIAKATVNNTQTEIGMIKGKVRYMSPEQALGQVDRRSDIFAMGVVLWEMLARRRLFSGETMKVLHDVATMDIPGIRSVRPEIDPELDAIVTKALAKDPDRRYQTAEQMRDALYAYAARSSRVSEEIIGRAMLTLFRDVKEGIAKQIQLQMTTVSSSTPAQELATLKLPSGGSIPPFGAATPPRIPANPTTQTFPDGSGSERSLSSTSSNLRSRKKLVAASIALTLVVSSVMVGLVWRPFEFTHRAANSSDSVSSPSVLQDSPSDRTLLRAGRASSNEPSSPSIKASADAVSPAAHQSARSRQPQAATAQVSPPPASSPSQAASAPPSAKSKVRVIDDDVGPKTKVID